MSGRVTEYEILDDVYDILAQGRFERNQRVVWKSKRGQKVLRELEAALLALPEKKLARDIFCRKKEDELQVCVLGAYALYKGKTVEQMDYLNPEMYEEDGKEYVEHVPYDHWWTGKEISSFSDMATTMGALLVEYNDEIFGNSTPEERYEKMLELIRKRIVNEVKA